MQRVQRRPSDTQTHLSEYVEIEQDEGGVEAEQGPAELEAMRSTVHHGRSYPDDDQVRRREANRRPNGRHQWPTGHSDICRNNKQTALEQAQPNTLATSSVASPQQQRDPLCTVGKIQTTVYCGGTLA